MSAAQPSFNQIIQKIESFQQFGIKLGLESVSKLLDLLGNPHHSMRYIHIAGSNGKGSTAAILSSILKEAGITTALYTSPHLVSIRERIRINGECISEEDFIATSNEVLSLVTSHLSPPTFFEIITVIALLYFSRMNVQWAVLETGMGGRLDATNAVNSDVQVITTIETEHTQYLGATVPEIAFEKAGIIKEGKTLVTAADREALRVISKRASEFNTTVVLSPRDIAVTIQDRNSDGQMLSMRGIDFSYNDMYCPLLGDHQSVNCLLAVAAADCLKKMGIVIKKDAIKRGIRLVKWPARIQQLSWQEKTFIIDGSHTPAALECFVETIKKYLSLKKCNFVFSCLDDKNLDSMINILSPVVENIAAVRMTYKRGMSEHVLYDAWKQAVGPDKVSVFSSVDSLIADSFQWIDNHFPVAIVGSLFLCGEFFEKTNCDICKMFSGDEEHK